MVLAAVVVSFAAGVVAGPWLRGLVFAHTVEYRQPLRCRCPFCGRLVVPVALHGLVAVAPVDGRCPICRTVIGPPTGHIEFIAAAVITLLALHAPSAWVLAAWCWTGLLGIALAAIDTTVHRLPDPLTVAAALGTLLLLAVAAVATGDYPALLRAVLGGLGLGLTYLILILATSTGMGRGDGQLALAIGTCLGWINIPTILTATAAAFLLASAYVTTLLVTSRLSRRDPIAFGPFMLLGALTTILLTTP